MTATDVDILDVTLIEPSQKHATIFLRFDALKEGEQFTIHNDHDPKPLYYQLLGQRGNIFSWDYLEKGPDWWKVTIAKRPNNAGEETLGAMAASDLRKAQVFKKYGLDFCCGGKKTLREACAEKGLDQGRVEADLQKADQSLSSRPLPYDEWSLDFLANFIVNTHHKYVLKTLPDLRTAAARVMKVHGSEHPELIEVHQLVEMISSELLSHMVKEERILFPYIGELAAASETNGRPFSSQFGTVQNPINMMEMEHEMVGEALAKIRILTNGYTLPVGACGTYSFLFRLLEEFEEDLHLHVHLENNILFPKALALEVLLNN